MEDIIEETAFRLFADAHPHEAFKLDPDQFWTFFHERCPSVSRETMERWLKEEELTAAL